MTLGLRHLPADALGLSVLGRRSLSGRPRPRELGGTVVPSRVSDLDEPGAHEPPACDLLELASALRASLEPLEPHPAVLASLDALETPGALAVVTGQQPGLLGGPLLHLYKALHTARLARELSRAWNRPVVPVFWNHGDDHDVAECNRAWILNRHVDLVRVGLAGLGSGRRPLARIELDEEQHRVGALVENVRQLLEPGPDRDPAIALFAPRAGESLARSFTRTFTRLLGHLGLVVLEPDALRAPLGRALARLVELDLAGALGRGAARLREHGLEPTHDPADTAWVYRLDDGARRALRGTDGTFRFDGEDGSRSAIELAAEIADRPTDFSAGAVLRPLVQDLCLPTAAYVGGFGELAYSAQCTELRAAAGLGPGAFVPRLHATLVTPGIARAAERAELSPEQALLARGELAARETDEQQPQVARDVRAAASAFAARLAELREAIGEVDRGLAVQSRRVGARAKELAGELAKRIDRAARNRTGKARRHLRHLDNTLWPRGGPQERALSTLQLVVMVDSGWIDELVDALDPFPTEHLLVSLQPREE